MAEYESSNCRCAYEANTGNYLEVHEDLLHEDGYNESKNLELEFYCQSHECEDCDDKVHMEGNLNVYEETSREKIITSNDSLNWTQEDYDSEDCDKKTKSVEEVIEKPDHKNLEETIGVILMSIATLFAFFVDNFHKEQDVHEDDENQDPIEGNYKAISRGDQVVHEELYHEDLSQDFEWKCCDYEANPINSMVVHEEPLYEDGYNERRNLELVICRQSFECEDCDNKFPLKNDLEAHEEISHEEVPIINWLNCSQEQYYEYYNFYEDYDETTDSNEDVFANFVREDKWVGQVQETGEGETRPRTCN